MVGPMNALMRFLVSLPLRPPELKAVGLEALTNKPALFVGRILLRKHAPDRPNDVHLEMTLSGMVSAPQAKPATTVESSFQP
jgi:hypothetical protein